METNGNQQHFTLSVEIDGQLPERMAAGEIARLIEQDPRFSNVRVEPTEAPDPYRIDGGWTVADVQARRPDLDNDRAMQVLERVERYLDANVGINWDVIDIRADECFPEADRRYQIDVASHAAPGEDEISAVRLAAGLKHAKDQCTTLFELWGSRARYELQLCGQSVLTAPGGREVTGDALNARDLDILEDSGTLPGYSVVQLPRFRLVDAAGDEVETLDEAISVDAGEEFDRFQDGI